MGADLIASFLWCQKDDAGKLALDWDAGRAAAAEVAAAQTYPLAAEYGDESWDTAQEYETYLLGLLDSFKRGLDGRDVGLLDFTTGTACFYTAGMSWGDSPTDAFETWGAFEDDISPGAWDILVAVGFIPDWYRRVGLVA